MSKSPDTLLISEVISLATIQKTVLTVMKEHTDIGCYLFGSYAKGTATTSSDIDILLLFDSKSHSSKFIYEVKEKIAHTFYTQHKHCQPIHGYKQNINENNHILFRQYINYGVHLSGSDITSTLNHESMQDLQQLEYTHYWTPMYLTKLERITNFLEIGIIIDEDSITWQYLYLVAYWFAKAQLTLVNKQNSLNNFTLLYIYNKRMQVTLTDEQTDVLLYLQLQRNSYTNVQPIEATTVSFTHSFNIIQQMIKELKDVSFGIENEELIINNDGVKR